MKKPLTISLIAVALILVIGSIYFFQPKEKAVVRVGYLPITACLPYFVGEEMGYFSKQGLEIKAVRFETSQQMMDGLLQGQVDVITSAASAVGLLVQEKSPDQFKVFGVNTNGTNNPLDVLLVKASSSIKTVQDLKGKKIGSFPGVQALTLLKKYLLANGLDPSRDVQIQEMKQDLHLQALDSGQVDAVLTYEPNATIGEQKGISKVLTKAPFAQVSVDPYPTGIFSISKSYLETNPQVAQKIITAFDQSMNYANNNQVEARKVLTKFVPIEQNITTLVPISHFETLATMDKNSFQKFADILFAEKVLTKQPDISAFLIH